MSLTKKEALSEKFCLIPQGMDNYWFNFCNYKEPPDECLKCEHWAWKPITLPEPKKHAWQLSSVKGVGWICPNCLTTSPNKTDEICKENKNGK